MNIAQQLKDNLDWLENTEEGKNYRKKYVEKQKIKEQRYDKFEKWLETNDFDKLLYRLILEHDENYIEKCYNNGFEPYLNNKLSFVFEYVIHKAGKQVTIKKLNDSDFPNIVWEFNGYYFQVIWGQGSINLIYTKRGLNRIFSI
ncbi:MAG: hypothetical protein ACOC33_03850 [bacterium]